MIDPHAALAVFATTLFISLVPAADTTLVILQSTLYGYRAGMAVALGVAIGMMVGVAGVALGTAALIQALPRIFIALKIVGALYLLYLARTMLTAAPAITTCDSSRQVSLRALFQRGFLMTVTNPAAPVILFALLSPFVKVGHGDLFSQLVQLGFFATAAVLLTFCGFSLTSHVAGDRWLRSARAQRALSRLGGVCIGLWCGCW